MLTLEKQDFRSCPVCGTGHLLARVFFEQNIDLEKLTSLSFSSRKIPEFMGHQLIQCPTCDLVYANLPPSEEVLSSAYHAADFDSSEEADDAATAYIRAMEPALKNFVNRQFALEIGTGTGVLLEHLSKAGYTKVIGVEPSLAAIAAAPIHRKGWIKEGIFKEIDFAPESLDLICCFMTMEHVREPLNIASSAYRLLRPGGAFITVTHNYRSSVNRLLGKRSPIIDIEHLQLFSTKSIRYLYEKTGYKSVSCKGFKNTYALKYWLRLFPLPIPLKIIVLQMFDFLGLGKIKICLNVGNSMTVGIKPTFDS